MTQTFAVDANNDLFRGADGNLSVISGLPAVLQACEHVAKTILGEMVLAVDKGLPYFESVWDGVPNVPHYQTVLRAALAAVDGVVEVTSLTVTQTGNVLAYEADITTAYGAGSISG